MAVQLINYDLNKEKTDADRRALLERIRRIYPTNCYIADSCYAVATSDSSHQVYEKIKQFFDDNDHVLITRVGSGLQGWLPEETNQWLRKYVE